MPTQITKITPQARVDLRSADGETGSPVRVTRYAGVALIEFVKEGRFAVKVATDGEQLSMWVPDSLVYPPDADVKLSAVVTSSLQPISGGPTTSDGPYGVHSARAYLADDPSGSGHRLLSLAFVHVHAGQGAEVTYDVTAVSPLA